MLKPHQEVFLIEIPAAMPLEVEAEPGDKPPAVALSDASVAFGSLLFETDLYELLAKGGVRIIARIVVVLEVLLLIGTALGFQIEPWLLEIEVTQHHGSGAQGAHEPEVRYMLCRHLPAVFLLLERESISGDEHLYTGIVSDH
jgi:hypothetical protein